MAVELHPQPDLEMDVVCHHSEHLSGLKAVQRRAASGELQRGDK